MSARLNPLAVSATEQPLREGIRLSRLDVGMLIVLVSMAIAGVVGLIAVLDAENGGVAVAVGLGLFVLTFQAGGTIACALACLARRRLEVVSFVALVAAGLAVDLFAVALWLDIDSEAYGKTVGIAFVWALFGLLILGLALACRPRDSLARALYLGANGASVLAAALVSILVLTTGELGLVASTGPLPAGFGNEDLLRPLAAVLVVLAALWLAALAASRVERPAAES